jgi:hypothetical protein
MTKKSKKKMAGWSIALAAPFLGGVIYYFSLFLLYLPAEDLHSFPVPRYAELVGENESGKSYDWHRASEEDGIPFRYELALKAYGWKKGEREGASVVYTKGNHKIDLVSFTKHISIFVLK